MMLEQQGCASFWRRQDLPFLPSNCHDRRLHGAVFPPRDPILSPSPVLNSRDHRTLHILPTWKLPALANAAKTQKRGFPNELRCQGDNSKEATAYF